MSGGISASGSNPATNSSENSSNVVTSIINPLGNSQKVGMSSMSCTTGYTMVDKECTPIPYLEESSKFVLTCPAEYTLNTNPDKSVVCVKNVASFTPHINMEPFSQNSIGNTNGKCKARY